LTVLEDDDGDGVWSECLRPVDDVNDTVMGFLWSMLGSPNPRRRWSGAHAVRSILSWCDDKYLNHLLKYASNNRSTAFQDKRLQFYYLHAVEWFLLALSRVSLERPQKLIAAEGWLRTLAAPNEHHVTIRGMAAKVLLELSKADVVQLNDEEKGQCLNINTDRSTSQVQLEGGDFEDDEDIRLYFDYESRDELLRPLSSAFCIGEEATEKRVKPIMQALAKQPSGEFCIDDMRRKLRFIRDDDYRTPRSVRSDSWSAYLSRHSVLKLFGQLLDGISPKSDTESYTSPENFLSSVSATSEPNFRWRADRREPVPTDAILSRKREKQEWLTEIEATNFECLLEAGGRKVLWGQWTSCNGNLRRTVRVRSALVNRDAGSALLSALRTVENTHDYVIPEAESSHEISESGYVMKGWVCELYPAGDIDAVDPWAGDLSSMIVQPADYIVDRLNLEHDTQEYSWCGAETACSLKRQCWADGDRHGEHEADNGDRLLGDVAFIDALVQKTGMLLVREVQVAHRYREHTDTWRPENERQKTQIDLIGAQNAG
jgi:hypothetical protein